ncbi:DUF3764 family protein [Rhodovulum sp. YNF3179]|uniref:DUF3764 family protein n=1 Tax=Rhodovulum sp. YNF3179 TaxID=3425127 RepID=UPI003D34D0C5
MKILVTFEISTPFADWHQAYGAKAPAREAAGITEIYCGHEQDNTAAVYCLFEAESLKVFNSFMQAPGHAEDAAKAGHLLQTTRAVALT